MNIYQALEKDHIELKQLLWELVSLKEDDDYRYVLIEEIRSLLIPHARAEESVFYNTLRAIDADKKIILHGYQEHLEAESLLRSLQVMDKMNMSWKGTAKKLQETLLEHIQDEETEIFDEARNAFSDIEAQAMGDAFNQLKPKIEQEGFVKSTVDMIINMMPPRLSDKIRSWGGGAEESRP
jgi:hemerythrin superfamily protein